MKIHALVTALSAALLIAQPASAITVFDPSNFVQNTLTAVRTLEQINNQIQQLQNEATMLINQARNLATLDFNIVNRLRSTLATTERLIAEAQGLAYDVANMDREFARLYPDQYDASISGERMAQDARERWQHTLDGLHTAMRMQAQVSNNLGAGRKRLVRFGESEPIGRGRTASDASNKPASGVAGQAIHTSAAIADYPRPRGFAGTGTPSRRDRARPRGTTAVSGNRHALHTASRRFLFQLTG